MNDDVIINPLTQEGLRMKITEIMKLSSEIQNFYDCYEGTTKQLYTKMHSGGRIDPEDLLDFLLENPHMMEIAQRIMDLK